MWGRLWGILSYWPGPASPTERLVCHGLYGPGPGPYPRLPDSSVMHIYMNANLKVAQSLFFLSPMSTFSSPPPPSDASGSPGDPASSTVTSRHIDNVLNCLNTMDASGIGKRKRWVDTMCIYSCRQDWPCLLWNDQILSHISIHSRGQMDPPCDPPIYTYEQSDICWSPRCRNRRRVSDCFSQLSTGANGHIGTP